jgi:hypothetical protein
MVKSKELDKTIDRFFRSFCKSLVEDSQEMNKDSTPAKNIATMVDRYGVSTPGFLNYSEFKELF